MKRTAGMLVTLVALGGLLGGLGGCVSTQHSQPGPLVGHHYPARPEVLPGFVGPWGQPVAVTEGAQAKHPGKYAKEAQPAQSAVVQASYNRAGHAHAGMHPHDLAGAAHPVAQPLAQAGAQGLPPPAMLNAAGALIAGPASAYPVSRSQLRFVGPVGGKIGWYVAGAEKDGRPVMIPHQLDIPGRYNFLQASIYRLKLSDIPGKPGLELYPTLEVVPANSKTEAFLAHNYIPVEFTDADLDQVSLGNYLTKVVYLPDPQYQTAATGGAGTSELVSSQLEAGVDPIAEAHRRGSILLVIRLGGIQLEAANTPPLDNPGPYGNPGPGGMGLMTPMPTPAATQAPVVVESKVVTHAPRSPRRVKGLLERD